MAHWREVFTGNIAAKLSESRFFMIYFECNLFFFINDIWPCQSISSEHILYWRHCTVCYVYINLHCEQIFVFIITGLIFIERFEFWEFPEERSVKLHNCLRKAYNVCSKEFYSLKTSNPTLQVSTVAGYLWNLSCIKRGKTILYLQIYWFILIIPQNYKTQVL